MPDFSALSNENVVNYLLEHYDDVGVGQPLPNMASEILDGIDSGEVAIEKRDGAFAVVCKANRKYPGQAGLIISYPPQADLMILFVASDARGRGIGRELLEQVKDKYMEDQFMELVCAGEKRKALFEQAGFTVHGITQEGLHYMVCPPRQQL